VCRRLARFVASKEIFRIIALSEKYKKLPSEIMYIEDEYTAFCLNEACEEISFRMKDKDSPPPTFYTKYSSFSELYKQYS